jgi:hypothetical protein
VATGFDRCLRQMWHAALERPRCVDDDEHLKLAQPRNRDRLAVQHNRQNQRLWVLPAQHRDDLVTSRRRALRHQQLARHGRGEAVREAEAERPAGADQEQSTGHAALFGWARLKSIALASHLGLGTKIGVVTHLLQIMPWSVEKPPLTTPPNSRD